MMMLIMSLRNATNKPQTLHRTGQCQFRTRYSDIQNFLKHFQLLRRCC